MPDDFLLKCEIHGSDLYRKVAKAILDHDGVTDEGIANYTGIPSIDLVRMILKDLIWSGMIKMNREFVVKCNWFIKVYRVMNQ